MLNNAICGLKDAISFELIDSVFTIDFLDMRIFVDPLDLLLLDDLHCIC